MDLAQAGIALKCRCGADMGADMAQVLFDDKGRVKVSMGSIRCRVCGARYHPGERLKYRLVQIDSKPEPPGSQQPPLVANAGSQPDGARP